MLNNLATMYTARAATHNYIFGFTFRHVVYKVVAYGVNAVKLAALAVLDYDSRNKTASLRFKPNKAQVAMLMAMGAEVVCTEAEFEAIKAATKYNRGEIFEKLITEAAGQTWTKDNVPFTVDGDLTVNGTKYQIKYQKATFANEASLRNLGA
jgi:hypothetical protein